MNMVDMFFSRLGGVRQCFGLRSFVLIALAISSLSSQGQNKEMKDAMEVKRLVEETDAYEKNIRKELAQKIIDERNKTIAALKRLAKKYKDKGERKEAREIRRQISKLEKNQGNRKGSTIAESDPGPESNIVEFGKEYQFKSPKIQGRITFMANGRVNIIYNDGVSPKNEVWRFEEKADHILIGKGGDLGRIYISEIPKSKKQSIMIRLGGKLRHHVLTASSR